MNRTSNAYNARMQVKRMNEKYRTQIESALINTRVYSSVEYPDSREKEHPTVVVEANFADGGLRYPQHPLCHS